MRSVTITTPKRAEEFKRTKGCIVKHFAFCYNNSCQVYKEAKYGISYWPQKLSPNKFRNTKEENKQNRLYYGKDMHNNNESKDPKRKSANPYLNTDYNSLYNFNPEKEIFSNTENTRIRSYAMQAKTVAQSN